MKISQPFDMHTHQIDSFGIYNLMFEDLDSITDFSSKNISIGLHPWKIEVENWVKQLEKVEQFAQNQNVVAIGECGLDRMIEIPMEVQKMVFEAQVKLAEKTQKPVIIHCVRAFDELLAWKKKSKVTVQLVVHGFNNNIETAQQLIKHGFYLSFGAALLNPNSNAAKIITQIPIEKIFLETDTKPIAIESVYEVAAKRLNIETEKLYGQIIDNLNTIGIWTN